MADIDRLYKLLILIRSFIYCKLSGLVFDKTWQIEGRIRVKRNSIIMKCFKNIKDGKIEIGKNFKCNNNFESNSIGLIQPCLFNISTPNSLLQIGNNVGISGSTINVKNKVVIGDNVLIGSGCLISDTDSHPLNWKDRAEKKEAARAAIVINRNAFIGARSIILKGVEIGEGAVVGAGSVVTKDIPPFTVACGNPARVVKSLIQ